MKNLMLNILNLDNEELIHVKLQLLLIQQVNQYKEVMMHNVLKVYE
jgi:hypothetical protein